MLTDIPKEELTAALDYCADQILWEAAVHHPPVDAFLVAERLGMIVGRDDAMTHRARVARLTVGDDRTRTAILLGTEPRLERRQWSVAHEIGESIADRVFALLGVRGTAALPGAREAVANQLASCLLLPRHWFAADGRTMQWDLYALKQCYVTASHELIARRMLEMAPPVIITVFDLGRVQWRRSNLPCHPPGMHTGEWAIWRTTHGSGRPAARQFGVEPCGLEEVRCWPVHEASWRREIMRTKVAFVDGMCFSDLGL